MQRHTHPGHPVWCAEDRNGIHFSEPHVHGNVTAQLMQIHRPALIIGPTWFEIADMRGVGNLLSMLSHPELAATVRRLAELTRGEGRQFMQALAGEYSAKDDPDPGVVVPDVAQPPDLPHHEECTVGEQSGFVRNPVTFRFEPVVVPS